MSESKITRVSLIIIVLFIIGIILKLTKPILFPFLLALFISYAISPLLDWMLRLKFPKALAIVLILIFTFAILYLLGLLLYSSGKYFASELPKYSEKINSLITDFAGSLARLPVKVDIPSLVSQFNLEKVTNFLLSTLGSFLSFLTNMLLVFVFVIFILAGKDKLAGKIARAFAEERAAYVTRVLESINRQIQKYLAVKTFLSLLNGALVALILVIFGVDFALLLGFVTFILNFIPSFGSIVATIIPVVIAFFQFGNSLTPIWVLISIAVTDTIMGNFIDPKLMGQGLDLSPLLVIFSLIFWGWLWGIPGMVLAVPLLAVMKIIFENIPSLRFLAVLMSK
ncbi:MAG: AI-2E family transporter [Candidatus Aminicenantes bacterium]|nr:AI-2E family transporter [Candidatus Aminicenantes bacterium]